MREHLRRAADRFGVVIDIDATPVEGVELRSLSSPVRAADGTTWWLRIGREHRKWIDDPDLGDFWSGPVDASVAVQGITIPRVLMSTEWDDRDGVRRVRADLMTLLPGTSCSTSDALRAPVNTPDAWWADLRRAVDTISATPTTRYPTRIARGDARVRKVFGAAVAEAYPVTSWTTAHNDLHWANLMAPDLAVLDWELWGPAPRGKDAATLHLFALLIPDVATRVQEMFGDLLETRDGQAALINVASRILHHADQDGNTDLARAVTDHIASLMTPITA
jgi:hypothetical protein